MWMGVVAVMCEGQIAASHHALPWSHEVTPAVDFTSEGCAAEGKTGTAPALLWTC